MEDGYPSPDKEGIGDKMKIQRLFEIVYILLTRETVTAKEFSEHFEVSVRTIYRDIEVLSAAGIPIYMSKGKGGGISMISGFVLDKAMITEEERRDILSSLNAISAVELGKDSGTNAVLRKLGSLFGKAEADWIEVEFSSWSDGEKEAELFAKIKKAVIDKKIVQFSYVSIKGGESHRTVEPLKLVYKGESWYLYGYCKKREDYRFFKLTRIYNFYVTDELFERRRPGNVLKKQKGKNYAKSVKLKLKIDKEMAFRVYDEYEKYVQLEDGSFLVDTEFPDDEWAVYYVLGYGGNCEVLEPENVRRKVKKEAERIVQKL